MAHYNMPTLHVDISNQFQQMMASITCTASGMTSFKHSRGLNRGGYLAVLDWVMAKSSTRGINSLSLELKDEIFDMLDLPGDFPTYSLATPAPQLYQARHPALTPPANGHCPLRKLPVELRRTIFSYSLPSRHVTIQPQCDDHSRISKNPERRPKHNTASDLMLLCKKFKNEITQVVYEERRFKIHVHQGILTGGIEFLDAGRQPLQYRDCASDARFERFVDGEEFGFSRLKNIDIAIFPGTEHLKHCAMSTYYMNLALVRLLQRSSENRIVSIKITFPDDPGEEDFWWDARSHLPRIGGIYGTPNYEFALRPFSFLSQVHNVHIVLPDALDSSKPAKQFVVELKHVMQSDNGPGDWNDLFDIHAQMIRTEFEDFVFRTKYGHCPADLGNWTESAWMEDEADENITLATKHGYSFSNDPGSSKRPKFEDDEMELQTRKLLMDEDIDEQTALFHQASEQRSSRMSPGFRLDTPPPAAPIGHENCMMPALPAVRHSRQATSPRNAGTNWYVFNPDHPDRQSDASPSSRHVLADGSTSQYQLSSPIYSTSYPAVPFPTGMTTTSVPIKISLKKKAGADKSGNSAKRSDAVDKYFDE